MFKSIEYKLLLWLAILAISCGVGAWLAARGSYFLAGCGVVAAIVAVYKLSANYRKFNSNILFLLNALDNGDFSFHFSTTKLSRHEKELNLMLNRIKEILANARREVMENEKFLATIVESAAAGIAIAEDNDSIRIANRAALKMLGIPVFTHLKQLRVLDPSYPASFKGMTPGKPLQFKVANEREELLISASVTHVTVRDMPLRIYSLTSIGNELEAREMESWIKLIRVMTHEIMNSIAPITSLSETLLDAYGEDGAAADRELYDNTVEAFRTINSTAKGLLSFVESYRKFTGIPKPETQSVELGALVSRTLALQNTAMEGAGIRLSTDPAEENITVQADPAQVQQVLVNLLKNAAEAVAGKPDARVTVSVTADGGEISLEVRNNGNPIPEDILPHIFVPFFTTKDTGTGIGLSLSRYIMRLHGGNLKYRRADGWTVFNMVFPSNTLIH